MSRIEDGQVAGASLTPSVYVLPQRIEFHLSKKSSFAFNGSSFKPQSASVSESSGPLHSSFENGMDSDFTTHTIVRRIGAGLDNLGNTCFLNSVLQCLTYTEPLVAYLQSGKHQNSCRVVGFCALCSIQKHVTRALQATGRVLAPKDLVSNLRCISRNFRNARQEDAHEFMVHLLESMHKCCLPSGVPSESSSAYEKSFVHKIFGGCLRSQVKCMQCSYSSDKFDPFLDLSLEIVKADSLQKALMRFTAQEQLDGGERRYHCQKCKQKVQALKQLTIDKAPYVLTIHLKRFGSHISGQKIDKKVQFGPSLNLKPFVSGTYDGDVKYTLYGVLVHAGWSTHSGHYYCFVRTSSGMWYSLDDSRVIQVSERTVMEQKAYMLFYVRDRKTSTPEIIANAVQKHEIVPTSTPNGSCSISASSQRLDNTSTPRPTTAVLDKVIQIAVENGTGSTAATCQGSQDKSAYKSVNSVQKVKTMTSVMQSGSCATDTIIQGFPKGSNVQPLACSKRSNDVAKPSECPTDVAVKTVPRHSDKDGSALEETAPKKKPDSKSGLSKSNSGLVSTDRLTSDAFHIPLRQKLKKKVLAYSATTHISKRMLYEASLNLQKRKKLKKVKRQNQQFAATNIVDEQMGPSTSHVTSGITVQGSSSPKKGTECGVSKKDSDDATSDMTKNEISIDGSCASELNIRIASGDTMPNGDDQSLKSHKMHATLTHQQDKQPSDLNGKINVDNGIAVNSSRNFTNTTVGRWDDIELESSQTVDAHNTKIVSIGYVADEWDEEYDRGKRKKVRTSNIMFGGPNPFQEIATMAAESKERSKRYNPAKKPFRR